MLAPFATVMDKRGDKKHMSGLTLSHNNTAHEHFDGPDPLKGHLALTRCLVQTKLVSKLVLAHSIGVVNLVSEDQEGDLGQLLDGEEGIELDLGLGESLVILGVDEEDNSANFGEVVPPEAAGYIIIRIRNALSISRRSNRGGGGMTVGTGLTLLVTTKVKSGESVVSDDKFLGCCTGSS
jgi:hypothetical protein